MRRKHCANLWEEFQATRAFKQKFRQFDCGSKKYQKATEPSIDELTSYVNKECRRPGRKTQNKALRQNSVKLAVQERGQESGGPTGAGWRMMGKES